jgi:basic amino acid/polyamine antiporter, APA family
LVSIECRKDFIRGKRGQRFTSTRALTSIGRMTEGEKPVLHYASLRRQIGLPGAVMLGLGSILGTGVFVGLAQATALAGPWVLLAIVLAGALAYCNAMSSAQLAAAYPVSGGTYEYGYRLLSPTWGFIAGWTFLLAKSASAATAALGIYLAIGDLPIAQQVSDLSPELLDVIRRMLWSPTAAALAFVFVMTIAVLVGLRRSAVVNGLLVMITVITLCVLLVVALPDYNRSGIPRTWMRPHSITAVLEAAAIAFVAFTGYGRLATLGEEVREPRRTIPLAIFITLTLALLLYLGVGWLHVEAQAMHGGKLSEQFKVLTGHATFVSGRTDLLSLAVAVAALTAMLGVLLNLILGLSRVWLAMGRRGDMPGVFASVSERTGTPVPATILAGAVICLLVLVGDVRLTWSFSAFSVLIYYAITNWACLRLPPEHRRYPRGLAWAGLVTCLSLAWFVEMRVWAVGVALIGVGVVWHKLCRRLASSPFGRGLG